MSQPEPDATTAAIARYLTETSFSSLGEAVVEITKKLIFDTVTSGMAGYDEPGCREWYGVVSPAGGRPEASVFGHGTRLPAHVAGAVNGAMCRALDMDDVAEEALVHPSATVVPAALAAAQAAGRPVSGKDFVSAVAVGVDLAVRLGTASTRASVSSDPSRTNVPTFLVGPFAAAGVGAQLWRLDPRATVNALGIAYSQTSGNLQGLFDGAHTVRLQQGLATGAGLLAARLAAAGATGATRIFEGAAGYFEVHWRGRSDRSAILDQLGTVFCVDAVSSKPYAGCKFHHTAIAASLEIAAAEPVAYDDIDAVAVHVPSREYFNIVCAPVPEKQRPSTSVAAQFSLPFAVASSLLRGAPGPESFTDGLHDREVLDLARRVTPVLVAESPNQAPAPSDVFVRLRTGRELHARAEVPPGHPLDPMSWADLEDKARRLAAYSSGSMRADRLEALAASCRDLEEVRDIDDWASQEIFPVR